MQINCLKNQIYVKFARLVVWGTARRGTMLLQNQLA